MQSGGGAAAQEEKQGGQVVLVPGEILRDHHRLFQLLKVHPAGADLIVEVVGIPHGGVAVVGLDSDLAAGAGLHLPPDLAQALLKAQEDLVLEGS